MGCTPVVHDNGIGDTWEDCIALGTYNEKQAMKACAAMPGPVQCLATIGCGSNVLCAYENGSGSAACWAYGGALAGRARMTPPNGGGCPQAGDPTWR